MEGISRRDFIKTTSVSAAGASMLSLGQLSSAFGFKKKRASRVVIAKDEDCIGDQAKVHDTKYLPEYDKLPIPHNRISTIVVLNCSR